MSSQSLGAAETPPGSNLAELTVSELSGALKRTIEDRFGHVRLRGEVSGWRGPHSSGHCYFSLKDQSARIDAVIWKGSYARMKVRPEEGLEVIATGKITTFPGKSSYQIIVEQIELAGLGALMALLERRRQMLAAEGLFDEARKQLLPFLPRVIGVVTSPTGAVIRDILHRLSDRFPCHVLVWPVRVQGETAGDEVAAAIDGFNALPEGGKIPRPDVIIVARGGGSIEDLLPFSDEAVVRAAANSLIPLVSAVGHETDWSLIDHAADLRAPTPTGAAEMVVPVRADLLAQARSLGLRLAQAARALAERRRAEFRGAARALGRAEELLNTRRQALDRAGDRLAASLRAKLDGQHRRLGSLGALLARHAPHAELASRKGALAQLVGALDRSQAHRRQRYEAEMGGLFRRFALTADLQKARIARESERIETATARIGRCWQAGMERRAARLGGLGQLLGSLGYRNVLARGFVVVRGEDGLPLARAAAVPAGAVLDLEFADGHVKAHAEGATRAAAPATRARASKAGASRIPPAGQGDLF